MVFISFLEIVNFVILETILDATLSTRMNTNDGVDKISWIISSLEIINVLIIAFLKNMMVFLQNHIQQVMLVQLQWMVYIYIPMCVYDSKRLKCPTLVASGYF